ncbi:HigA family addiction module antitoxin [Stutzerimonas nosocomialis]|uniref:HigA family addiction module antitoxin n=1 Tax=Stutzerimonas nosocomialis TaxID=1056496 RepID=UPI0039C8F397
MSMHNPPRPGEFITDIYLEPNGISGRELAEKLGVAPSTVSRVLKGTSRVTPEMALRLSIALGRSPESWLAMQMPTICGLPGSMWICSMLASWLLRE